MKKEKDGQSRRHEKEGDRFICPFPECGKLFWKDPGKPNACPVHRQLIDDVVYILNHLKDPQEVQKSGLFIPKPGTSLQEMIAKRG